MGFAKNWAIEQDERGYSEVEGNICADCLTDEALKAYVRENLSATECDYCGKVSDENIAADFDDVMGVIFGGITLEWNTPDDEGISYVTAEGGYLAKLTYTDDLLSNYEITDNDKVFSAIQESIINDAWVEHEYMRGTEDQRLLWGWGRFCHEIIHKMRYLFLHNTNLEEEDGVVAPSSFLYELADFKNRRLDAVSLITTIEPLTSIYRVRIGQKQFASASEIGAPPEASAILSNRMSPAGIPMFYGAFDAETSIMETYDPQPQDKKQVISIGTFTPVRALKFLDLSILPQISVFDPTRRHLIAPLRFFRSFADDMAKQIARDGREHRDYVPTQVVTEFFRHIYRTGNNERLDGIIYRSSKNKGKPACVIFCENDQACDKEEKSSKKHLLRMIDVKHRSTS